MHYYKRSASALAVVGLLTACGLAEEPGGGGSSGKLTVIDEQSVPQVNPSTLERDSASITAPIYVALKEKVDGNTVIGSNVHLMPMAAHNMDAGDDNAEEDMTMMNHDPIPGTVSYDEGKKQIKFVPKIALEPGRTYHLHIAGVTRKGKALEDGINAIDFSFTTAHAHEYFRKEFDEFGQIAEIRYTDTQENIRAMRTEYEVENGIATLDYKRHYGAHPLTGINTATDKLLYWQEDGPTGGLQRYEVERTVGNQTYNVRFRFRRDAPGGFPVPAQATANDPVWNFWTPGIAHHGGHHTISYQYEPIANRREVDTPWPASGDPAASGSFTLDDAQLVEMDHSLPANSGQRYQHRHIFYGDVGEPPEIDFNAAGDPDPTNGNDRVVFYHTRDLNDLLRTHEWSWLGQSRNGSISKYGNDNQLFTADDLAYRVRVYVYDELGRRIQRVTYEVTDRNTAPYGLTRTEWGTVLSQSGYQGHQLISYGMQTAPAGQAVFTPSYQYSASHTDATGVQQPINVKVHSYRIYEYEPNTTATDQQDFNSYTVGGSLKSVIVYHENDAETALFREEERYYTTEKTVTGKTKAQSLGLTAGLPVTP